MERIIRADRVGLPVHDSGHHHRHRESLLAGRVRGKHGGIPGVSVQPGLSDLVAPRGSFALALASGETGAVDGRSVPAKGRAFIIIGKLRTCLHHNRGRSISAAFPFLHRENSEAFGGVLMSIGKRLGGGQILPHAYFGSDWIATSFLITALNPWVENVGKAYIVL